VPQVTVATPTGLQLQAALDVSGAAATFGGDAKKTVQVFPPPEGGGRSCVQHPVLVDDPDEFFHAVCGTPGDVLVTYDLQLVSVSPDYPDLVLTQSNAVLKANLEPVLIRYRAGFSRELNADEDLQRGATLEAGSNGTFAANWTGSAVINPLDISFSASGGEKAGGFEDALGPAFTREASALLKLEAGFLTGEAGFVIRSPGLIEITGISAEGGSSSAVTILGTPADANAGRGVLVNVSNIESTTGASTTAGAKIVFRVLEVARDGSPAYKAVNDQLTGSTSIQISQVLAETKPFGDYNLTEKSFPNETISVSWSAIDVGMGLEAPGGAAIDQLVVSTHQFRMTDYLNFTDLEAEIRMPSGFRVDPAALDVVLACWDEQPDVISSESMTLDNGLISFSPAEVALSNTSFQVMNESITVTVQVGQAMRRAMSQNGYASPPRLDGATC